MVLDAHLIADSARLIAVLTARVGGTQIIRAVRRERRPVAAPQPLYVDPAVLQHETVVFAAGSQTESVQLKTADLLRHEQVPTLPLIKHADDNGKDWLR